MPLTLTLVGFPNVTDGDGQTRIVRRHQDATDAAEPGSDLALVFDTLTSNPHAVLQRRVDVSNALRDGRRIFLVAGPNASTALGQTFGNWLLQSLLLTAASAPSSELRVVVPQLAGYFHDHLGHLSVDSTSLAQDGQVLADLITPDGTATGHASIRLRVGQAEVFVVPVQRIEIASYSLMQFIALLPPLEEYPIYLDELIVGPEQGADAAIHRLQNEITALQGTLQASRDLKKILYVREAELEQEVARFLQQELGLKARQESGNREDFWLLTADDNEWAIGEVKGPGSSNVSVAHVSALVVHRSEAGRGEDFPALLVANTFNRATDLGTRDQPLAPNVCRRAAEDHIVVVRTLDLFRLKRILDRGDEEPRSNLLAAVREGGGWFEVDRKDSWRLHGS